MQELTWKSNMGKASRLKRERRSSTEREKLLARARHLVGSRYVGRTREVEKPETPVYRFFKELEHAKALAAGNVWLSTLEVCRQYEDPAQGDPHEGHLAYRSGIIKGNSGDPHLMTVAKHAGIFIGEGCSNITIDGVQSHTRLPDAYVLCTTDAFAPEKFAGSFGKYCVEISNPASFFELVTEALRIKFQVVRADFGRVIYAERTHYGLQSEPGPLGFVKPPALYKQQSEVRFLWTVQQENSLTPFMINVPGVTSLCRRIM